MVLALRMFIVWQRGRGKHKIQLDGSIQERHLKSVYEFARGVKASTTTMDRCRVTLCPRGPLAISGDICGCHSRGKKVLLASSEERPGLLLNILQCTGQPGTVQNYPA